MKHNNIKIAIIEEGNFYNNLIESQIFDLCNKMHFKELNWVIKSFTNAEDLLNDAKRGYKVFVFDNYSKKNNKSSDYSIRDVIDEIKLKNKDCLFISISGYREMLMTAEYYVQGELQMFFSKQSNLIDQSIEDCSIPTLYKLMDRFLTSLQQKEIAVLPKTASSSQRLRISA